MGVQFSHGIREKKFAKITCAALFFRVDSNMKIYFFRFRDCNVMFNTGETFMGFEAFLEYTAKFSKKELAFWECRENGKVVPY